MKAFFQEIAKAVSDFKFYKQVKNFPLSKGMKYIFSLIFVITLVLTIRYNYDLRKGLDMLVEWTRLNLPPIEIQDGVVTVDVRQPYKVEDEDFILIIDTTGEITSLDDYQRGVLLMKDRLVYKESEVKTETHSLSDIKALKIDESFMKLLRKNMVWMAFPFMLIGFYIYLCIARFIQIFLFSPVSLLASSIAGIKLNYRQLFNIGLYAITTSTILGALLGILARPLPFFGIIYSGVYIIYLIMAILNCKETSAAPQENV